MNAATSSSLDRLLADLPLNGHRPSSFLDGHKEDVVIVLKEKGTTLTAELLGISPSAFSTWAYRRKIQLPGPRISSSRTVSPQPVSPQERSADYWRGMAQAYREALELLLKAE